MLRPSELELHLPKISPKMSKPSTRRRGKLKAGRENQIPRVAPMNGVSFAP